MGLVVDIWSQESLLAPQPHCCFSTPVSANHFGPSGCCAYADSLYHNFNQASTGPTVDTVLDYARGVFHNETAMATGDDTTPDSSTDMLAYDNYYTDYWGVGLGRVLNGLKLVCLHQVH